MSTGSGQGTPITPVSGAFSSDSAFAMFLRRNPWMSQRIVQEPLTGLVDGSNLRFNLASPPAVAYSLSIIKSDGTTVTPSAIDHDSGAILLSSAPTSSLYASYTNSLVSTTDAYGLFEEGFALMESLWSRSYYLVATGEAKAISSTSLSVIDPVIGTTTFSERVPQTALAVDCMFYVWVNSALAEATYNAIAVREQRASGLQIDRTRQPDTFKLMLEGAEKRMLNSLSLARLDYGEDPVEIGAVPGLRSTWNYETAWWQPINGGTI